MRAGAYSISALANPLALDPEEVGYARTQNYVSSRLLSNFVY